MVIQVEDAAEGRITNTNLKLAIDTIEQIVGVIKDEEIAHCFQEAREMVVGERKIKHVDPSNINGETEIKFVFFKMALTTGWDCPRAEVMMSFRKAQDATLIAQLIGRMIRTPLAKRIEGNEILNEVSLYLPYYDKKTLKGVIDKLHGDNEASAATDIVEGDKLNTFTVPEILKEEHTALNGLPSYRKGRKVTDIKRLLSFCNLLSIKHKIDEGALSETKELIVTFIKGEVERLFNESSEFANTLRGLHKIEILPVIIKNGELTQTPGDPITLDVNAKNVDDLYRKVKQKIPNEICIEYLRHYFDENEPFRAKLELFMIGQNKIVWEKIEALCKNQLTALKNKNQAKISNLLTSERVRYDEVWASARRKPEAQETDLPTLIRLPKEENVIVRYQKHIFSDQNEFFDTELNEWEHPVIMDELNNDQVVAWLRNFDRKPWALGIPYELDFDFEIMYPDFLIVREIEGQPIVDIIEPHHQGLRDSLEKAKGLAQFAIDHGTRFGRIQLVRIIDGNIKRLELNDQQIQLRTVRITSHQELNNLFNDHAF